MDKTLRFLLWQRGVTNYEINQFIERPTCSPAHELLLSTRKPCNTERPECYQLHPCTGRSTTSNSKPVSTSLPPAQNRSVLGRHHLTAEWITFNAKRFPRTRCCIITVCPRMIWATDALGLRILRKYQGRSWYNVFHVYHSNEERQYNEAGWS